MRLSLGLSPSYVPKWTPVMALRELCQNAIDSGAEYDIAYANGKALISDKGSGIQLKHLVLGLSDKPSSAIGQYGEGLKLAMLVMVRSKRQVTLVSNGVLVTPVIDLDKGYGTETLQFDVNNLNYTSIGTTISAECSLEELNQAFMYFEALRKDQINYITPNISTPGGNVYVNGSVMAKLPNSLYSYHFTREQLPDACNRDREVVNELKLRSAVNELLLNHSNTAIKKDLIKSWVSAEAKPWETSCEWCGIYVNHSNRLSWKICIEEEFGANIVVASWNDRANTRASYAGYRVLGADYTFRTLMTQVGIPLAENIDTSCVERNSVIPAEALTEAQRDILHNAITIIEKYIGCMPTVEVISIFKENPNVEGVTVGMYDGNTKTIYISVGRLCNLTDAVSTLVHEYVHHSSGCNDLTEAFMQAWQALCVDLLFKLVG